MSETKGERTFYATGAFADCIERLEASNAKLLAALTGLLTTFRPDEWEGEPHYEQAREAIREANLGIQKATGDERSTQ
jgi:hypothetical protein